MVFVGSYLRSRSRTGLGSDLRRARRPRKGLPKPFIGPYDVPKTAAKGGVPTRHLSIGNTGKRDMEFRILGPLEVVRGSRRLELGGPKQRAVLAALVLEPNRVVPLYRLLDQLWGEEPPPRATATLQAYVSNLRRILEPERRPRAPATVLVTQAPGYLLRVDPGRIDFLVFEALATKGRQLLADGKPHAARDAFTESLALWRGPALADFLDEGFSRLTATRLEDERLDALEGRIDADLALGQHTAVIPELEHQV